MAKVQLVSEVTGFFVEGPDYALEGRVVGLAGNGAGLWRSTANIEVEGDLGIFLKVLGPAGTAWKLSISCSNANEPFYVRSGVTNPKGFFMLLDTAQVPCEEEEN